MNKEEIFQHRSREMRDFAAYCFVCGRTELLYDEPGENPENGINCSLCFEGTCAECAVGDICKPCAATHPSQDPL